MTVFEVGALYEYRGNPHAPEVDGSIVMFKEESLTDFDRVRVDILSGDLLEYHPRHNASVLLHYLRKIEPVEILGDNDDDCI